MLFVALLCMLAPVASAGAVSGTEPITTVAGTGVAGFGGDGFSATQALLRFPTAVAVDSSDNIYIAEYSGNRVRKVDSSGIITTVAGNGSARYSGDGGPATQAGIGQPSGVAVDGAGNLYISSFDDRRVRKVDSSGVITTVAGDGSFGYAGDGGPASEAALGPCSVAVSGAGDLYIGDCGNNRLRKVDTATGIITTVAGNGNGPFDCEATEGVPATQTTVRPDGLTVDPDGNVYLAEFLCHRVRKLDSSGLITTVAGTGTRGYGGDGGPATQAQLAAPIDVGLDPQGNLYIADLDNRRVRKVDTEGIITTVAGDGSFDYGGDFGPANEAQVGSPWGLALDRAGSLYIADGDRNHRLRRVGLDQLFLAESHAPDPATEENQITHTFTVRNLADTASTGVKLTDTLSSDVEFISGDPACSQTRRTVTCNVGSIAAGDSATVEITVKALRAGVVPNKSIVSSNEAEPYPPTNTVVSPTLVSARGCGRVITRNTVLGNDLGPCAANGIVIGADNVTLDLRGRRIYGFLGPSGPDGDAAGVLLEGRKGATVKNGTVTGFDAGVVVTGGSSNTLTKLTLTDNIGPDDVFNSLYGDGIFIDEASSDNRIVGNTLSRNGVFDGIGIYGANSDSNVVENNVVENTVGPSDGGPAGQGLILNGADEMGNPTMLSGTRVANNTIRGNASGGIANVNNRNGSIVGNTVEGNGASNARGNGIGVQVGRIWDPAVPLGLLVEGNEVHGNGWNGIEVASRARGNRILGNDAANNGAHPEVNGRGFDLRDRNSLCATNTWFGNIWGSAGFTPACTATGGSQATAAASARTATATMPQAEQWKQKEKAWERFAERGRRR